MKITLQEGDVLVVDFEDENGLEIDGHFKVVFDKELAQIRIEANLQDTSGRVGVIYLEDFSVEQDGEGNKVAPDQTIAAVGERYPDFNPNELAHSWEAGYRAFLNKEPCKSPYKSGLMSEAWRMGWNLAKTSS